MILFFLACSESEQNFVDHCEWIDDFLVCNQQQNYRDAQFLCAEYGTVLVDTQAELTNIDLEKEEKLWMIGALSFDGKPWWSGIKTYKCTAQLPTQAWVPQDCQNKFDFICEE